MAGLCREAVGTAGCTALLGVGREIGRVGIIRANGQLLTDSNYLGTHLDGEIHFFTAGKDIAQLALNDFLAGPGVGVGLSDHSSTPSAWAATSTWYATAG